eukprot:6016514-Amphidinium_carterae.1
MYTETLNADLSEEVFSIAVKGLQVECFEHLLSFCWLFSCFTVEGGDLLARKALALRSVHQFGHGRAFARISAVV